MKKPILIVNVPNDYNVEDEKKKFEEAIKSNDVFKDFEVVIFWGCEASIYYPPNTVSVEEVTKAQKRVEVKEARSKA